MQPKLLIVDDQKIIREGLFDLLVSSNRYEVLAPAESGEVVLKRIGIENPDIILMDLRMPGMNGLETCEAIYAKGFDNIPIVFLTAFDEPDLIRGAMQLKMSGFLLKHLGKEQLFNSIDIALAGGVVIDQDVAAQIGELMASSSRETASSEIPLLECLTAREGEVLALLQEGYSNKSIARKLGISNGTVRNHLSVLFEKLQVKNRTQAVLKVYELAGKPANPIG